MSVAYLVVTQRLWRNETGDGVSYGWDGAVHPSRPIAVLHGLETLETDDFNIATVVGARIVAFGYDLVDFGPDTDDAPHGGHDLDDIASQIGWPPPEVRRRLAEEAAG
ncbi:hypothetical protein ACFFX1_55400 [Dactylosporangium sucinum]|uniref:Uncharacterized protein n=1 Tax=Dactylosporangium sucinum TaxID=1424081 RepID=A0A917U3N8_9ACTN|nr:hypothetical protein [Dactylosporangium sucinum]GGM52705.1 hypothetical protein GCM10007977_062840 [Dactylosporangium sucinum]